MDVEEGRVLLALLVAGGPHDPGVHAAAVRRDGGEHLGPDQLAAGGERVADVREAHARGGRVLDGRHRPGVVELAQVRRVARREHQAAGGDVEAGDLPLAAHQHARLAGAVGRDRVDVHAAVVLHDEQQLAVAPQRLAHAGVRAAVAVERRGEQRELAALRVDHGDLGVPGVVPHAGQALDGEAAVREPGDAAHGPAALGETPRLRAGGVHQVHVVDHLEVPVGMTGGDEGDGPPVRRPGRRVVLVVAAGELRGLGGAVGRHHEEVLRPAGRPADAVELVLQPREASRTALLVVLLLVRPRRARAPRRRCACRPATTPPASRPP